MRWRTGILALLVVGLVTGLYHLKQEVQGLEHRLASVKAAIARDREAIRVLKAEWSYLNRPARLARLARRFLRLRALAPGQIRTFADLPARFDRRGRVDPSAKAEASR